MMGFGMMGGGFFSLLIIGAIIYFVMNGMNHQHHGHHYRKNDALELLKERYAKGEISDEEFDRKKRMLEREGR